MSGDRRYPSEKMVSYAKMIADETGSDIPGEVINDSVKLKEWIEEQSSGLPHNSEGQPVFKPTMNQVSFAEKIAQATGSEIPTECYQDRKEMSKWIDGHKSSMPSGRPTEKMITASRKIYDYWKRQGSTVPDPAALENDFQGMRDWLDANYPQEWRR